MSGIGIFGGTFDPVHIAHLIIANYFLNELKLEKCIFIPAYLSPHKVVSETPASAEDRLTMLKLALNDCPAFEIDTYELDKKDVSYTYQTIEYLKEKYFGRELYLLIGSDQAENFDKWRHWQWICQNVQVVIAKRTASEIKEGIFEYAGCQPIFLNNPIVEISSTGIRMRVRDGKSIAFLVPKEVEKYIREHNLYK